MADAPYQSQNFLLASKGVMARYADDASPSAGFWLDQNSLEEIEESGLATRLGTTILSKSGGIAKPLGGTAAVIHSLSRLPGLNGASWRYGGQGTGLYRLSGTAPGEFTQISNALSGNPWTSVSYQPVVSSYPYQYFADLSAMLKDNGTLAAPQNMGILQPQYPVQAVAQNPDEIILDPFTGGSALVSTTTSLAVTTVGLHSVTVANPDVIGLFQSLRVDTGGNQETVLVLATSATGFTAYFTKTHLSGVAVAEYGVSTTVGASTTGVLSNTLPTSISTWPTTLEQEDYIGLWMYVGDPNAIQSITLQFNTANGANFFRTIGQGPLQPALNAATDSSTAAADAVLSDSLGLYMAGSGGVTGLSTVPGWTPILLQLSDFSGAGGADFNDPVMNWQNVTGYEVTIVTGEGIAGTSFPITVKLASLVLFGGAGPDSFAGVSYDYMVTLFNINDYTESNPSMAMTSVNPPTLTNWVTPRRQPVLLNWINSNIDTQATHWRVYRRGGTFGDNYRRIGQIPITAATGGIQSYTDLWSDLQIQQSDTISFLNDVPVTSTLPVPVNTTLTAAIGTPNEAVNSVETITPASMANISVNQQVDLGDVAADNFEVVIVLSITRTTFNAYVQNYHAAGEPVAATAAYAFPLDIVAVAFDTGWFAGDTNNPSYLYFSTSGNIQAVGSASYVQVNVPSDPITAIVPTRGNLFVSTVQRWWSIAPGSQAGQSPTVYPTSADHGCVGKNAWCLKDGIVYYLAVDGPRIFTGGGSQLISEIVQFIWQGIGPTPLPVADPNYFSNARVSYWNQFVFFAYTGLDGKQHRLVLDTEQKRWRNDDIDAQSLLFEQDTNAILFGDSNGLVHLDRQAVSYDESNAQGLVVQTAIAVTLQSPYGDQGAPEVQKQYQEFTIDANTNGNLVTATIEFNDGEFSQVLGTIKTTERQRINLNLNSGAGFQAYKASLLLTGAGTSRIYLYQAKLKYMPLAMTRQSLDTYWDRFGDDASKIAKQLYLEYNAASDLTGNVYYDGSATPGYTFTMPQYSGVRNSLRVRLPAVKFRLARLIITAATPGKDFQVWGESRWEVKPLCQGKGYQFHPLFT